MIPSVWPVNYAHEIPLPPPRKSNFLIIIRLFLGTRGGSGGESWKVFVGAPLLFLNRSSNMNTSHRRLSLSFSGKHSWSAFIRRRNLSADQEVFYPEGESLAGADAITKNEK